MKLVPFRRGGLLLLPAWLVSTSLAAQSTLDFNPGGANWNQSDAFWSLTGNPTAWIQGASARFFTGNAQTLRLTEDITASALSQELAGSHMTFEANADETLTLTGNARGIEVRNGSDLTLGSSLTVAIAPESNSAEHTWSVEDDGNLTVAGILTGGAGSVVEGVVTGGLVKTGSGTLTLSGANTYSGVTQLKEGAIVANHGSALGTSQLRFNGGVLRYGSQSPTGGFASQFLALESGQSARLDTAGQNVTLNAGITGVGGLEKLGTGTLTLSSGNTYTGPTVVRAGVLKAAAGGGSSNTAAYVVNPFGTNNVITIENGGSLDLNGNALGGPNTKRYEVVASGLGAAGHATIFNSGNLLSNASLISRLTFTSDISIGGSSRMDLQNMIIEGGTNTLYKRGTSELSWISNNASNTVGDIVVEQGTFTLQASTLGSTSHSVVLRPSSTLRAWGSVSLNKKLLSYGNSTISLNGSNPTVSNNNDVTFQTNYAITLSGGTTQFTGSTGYRQGYYNAAIGGTGNLTLSGTTSTSLMEAGGKQTTSHVFKDGASNFEGDLLVQNSVLRLSDASLAAGTGGTLGATTNQVTLRTGSGDHHTNLDLHGTSQTIGALVSSDVGTARIQNRRANSTSTLTVGQGNAGGTFSGVIEDYSETFHGKAFTSDGNTGKLALTKQGNGTQILTGVNTFTAGLQVLGGNLQIGSGATGTSTAKAGNSAFIVGSGATLSGNGTVGTANLLSTVQAGGKLSIGTSTQTAAQTLQLAGSLSHHGTVSFDIFQATLGSGDHAHSDILSFLNNSLIDFGGTLEVTDQTQNAQFWTEGTWFRLFDWTQVTNESNREVTFDQWILPTLGAQYTWDTSQLMSQGRIMVTSVPEPSRVAFGLLALLSCAFRRRRR